MLATSPFGTFKLREDQKKFIAQIYDLLGSGNTRVACVAPTGSGKTVIASEIIRDAMSHGKKVLFLVTIDCLIEQTLDKLRGIPVGVIAGKHPQTEYNNAAVFVASLQSLARRKQWLQYHWDLAIWDEAHTSCWFGIAKTLLDSSCISWHLGFTATPYRLSRSQSFQDIFQDVAIAPSMGELIAKGNLVPLKYYAAVDIPDLEGIRTVNGDYENSALSVRVNTYTAIMSALEAREKHAPGKRTIAFGVNVKHAEAIAEVANAAGVKSAVVVGSTINREEIFAKLENLEIEMISSCQVEEENPEPSPQLEKVILRQSCNCGSFTGYLTGGTPIHYNGVRCLHCKKFQYWLPHPKNR